MVVKEFGNAILTKATPITLFEALGGDLPGSFGGKIDLNALADVADEIKITLQTKYTSGGAYVDNETPSINGKQGDKVFRFTDLEENYGYKLIIELVAASPSASATLAYVITRTSIS